MRKTVREINSKCTELRYSILKKMIKSKFMNYPYHVYLKRTGMNNTEISLYLTSIELGLNRAISNLMSNRKNY